MHFSVACNLPNHVAAWLPWSIRCPGVVKSMVGLSMPRKRWRGIRCGTSRRCAYPPTTNHSPQYRASPSNTRCRAKFQGVENQHLPLYSLLGSQFRRQLEHHTSLSRMALIGIVLNGIGALLLTHAYVSHECCGYSSHQFEGC